MDSSDSGENSSEFSCNCRACAYPQTRNHRNIHNGVGSPTSLSFDQNYGRAFCVTMAQNREEAASRTSSSLCLYDVQKTGGVTASERSFSPLLNRAARSQSCSSGLDEFSSGSSVGRDYSPPPSECSIRVSPTRTRGRPQEKFTVKEINNNDNKRYGAGRRRPEHVKFINVWFGNLITPNSREFIHQDDQHTEVFINSGWDNNIVRAEKATWGHLSEARRRHAVPLKVSKVF